MQISLQLGQIHQVFHIDNHDIPGSPAIQYEQNRFEINKKKSDDVLCKHLSQMNDHTKKLSQTNLICENSIALEIFSGCETFNFQITFSQQNVSTILETIAYKPGEYLGYASFGHKLELYAFHHTAYEVTNPG